MLSWTSAYRTDVGAVRTINEDAVLSRPEDGFWAVIDGMGGQAAENVASAAIVYALTHAEFLPDLADFIDLLDDSLTAVNAQLRAYSKEELNGRTIGATLAAMILGERTGVCLWAGDCRLYRLRGTELTRISRDHTSLQDLIDSGVISLDQVREFAPEASITRGLGLEDNVILATAVFAPLAGDTYLLCSDGLYNQLNDEALVSYLNLPAENAVQGLINAANESGARDNVSAVVVKLSEVAHD